MKLGVNSDVNSDGNVDVGIRHNLGISKVKLPHAHPHMLRKVGDTINIESLDDKTIPKTVKRTDTTRNQYNFNSLRSNSIILFSSSASIFFQKSKICQCLLYLNFLFQFLCIYYLKRVAKELLGLVTLFTSILSLSMFTYPFTFTFHAKIYLSIMFTYLCPSTVSTH